MAKIASGIARRPLEPSLAQSHGGRCLAKKLGIRK